MGYKLAGYDVVAANDIDPQMQKLYEVNHHPNRYFLCDVKELLKRDDLPIVDVLDGSPPCSVFSMAGLRENAWGKNKYFREGQSKQILDDLFFDFIKLVEKMQPKILIAENVRGMIIGNAKWYTREISRRLQDLGYKCQIYLLNSAHMGVPQKRLRVFFIAHKTNKYLELQFTEKPITFSEISDDTDTEDKLTNQYIRYWHEAEQGNSVGRFMSRRKESMSRVPYTVIATQSNFHPKYKRNLNKNEIIKIGSWPSDYDFTGLDPNYVIGMSVPPIMMAQVAHQVYEQLLKDHK